MNIDGNKISAHRQIKDDSCVPMSVELVLKLLCLMPVADFSFQNDGSKLGHSNWVQGLKYPQNNPEIVFSREFLLSDRGLQDRGSHFIQNHFEQLFETIDEELENGRFVIISLESNPKPNQMWHNEVIFEKVDEDNYKTITCYNDGKGPHILVQNLRKRVKEMEGTDILTYKLIK